MFGLFGTQSFWGRFVTWLCFYSTIKVCLSKSMSRVNWINETDGGSNIASALNLGGTIINLTSGTVAIGSVLTFTGGGITLSPPTAGGVSSVAMTAPSEFTVGGSPITSSGTLALTKTNQSPNTIWAGPAIGPSLGQPTFRALTIADLPAGVGTVTSVAMSVPTEFTLAGSPITSSGTLAVTKATQAANRVWAGPTTGAAAQPSFRALVAADLPGGGTGLQNLAQVLATGSVTGANNIQVTVGQLIDFLGGGMKIQGNFLRGSNSIAALAVVDSVGADSYIEVQSLFQNVNLNARSASANAAINIVAKGTSNIYTYTDLNALLWHNAFLFTDKQIRGGAGRVGPADPPVSQGPGALKLTFASTFFDDRPAGYSALVDSVNYTIKLGLLPSSTWVVSGSVTGQQNAIHAGNTTLELVLYYNNNGSFNAMARQRMPWFSTDTTFTSSVSAVVAVSNVGTQEVYCVLENNSPATIQINTYRLQAVMQK